MTPLQEALHVYENRGTYPRETLLEAAASLGTHGVFSVRGIAAITGLSYRDVARVVHKTDRTGGKLHPAVLTHLARLVEVRERNEADVIAAARALEGVSANYAERLTGIPDTTLRRWAKVGRAL